MRNPTAIGRARPKRRISFSFSVSSRLPKPKPLFAFGSSSSDEEEEEEAGNAMQILQQSEDLVKLKIRKDEDNSGQYTAKNAVLKTKQKCT
ncbi:Glutamate receptor-interacting protein 1 [Bagarius yarrelli]|uniref:Glutamate receptor-interacting protein 1 n=1 Tax=Bagarius yarrelli TaxID=175774 RepID=A0A556VXG4_BAGYA|nr:Glutamate receptor-interacting protein 1 [Bagarius yarrelli]